jgi:hypothetical protein
MHACSVDILMICELGTFGYCWPKRLGLGSLTSLTTTIVGGNVGAVWCGRYALFSDPLADLVLIPRFFRPLSPLKRDIDSRIPGVMDSDEKK